MAIAKILMSSTVISKRAIIEGSSWSRATAGTRASDPLRYVLVAQKVGEEVQLPYDRGRKATDEGHDETRQVR